MSEAESGDRESERSADRWLRPLVEDSLMWPVLAAALLSFASIGAAALFAAVWDRNLFAMAAVAVCAGASAFGLEGALRRRRLGLPEGVLLSLWLLSGLGALAMGWLIS